MKPPVIRDWKFNFVSKSRWRRFENLIHINHSIGLQFKAEVPSGGIYSRYCLLVDINIDLLNVLSPTDRRLKISLERIKFSQGKYVIYLMWAGGVAKTHFVVLRGQWMNGNIFNMCIKSKEMQKPAQHKHIYLCAS